MKLTISRRRFVIQAGLSPFAALYGGSLCASQEDAPPGRKLRFAVASDGHFGQPETDYERFHREMIGWLNREGQGKGLQFVVFNGDLIHNDPVWLEPLRAHYERLSVPYYVTKGNHDMASPSLWEEIWGRPQNYELSFSEYGLLLGTTSNEKGEYLCVDRDWLEEGLSRFSEKKGVFVFLHISQHAFTRHGIDCPEVTALLEEAENVKAVFHGHDHDLDNVIFSRKKPYLFDSHMGGSWGTNYRGYRIVEVDEDDRITSYQCNPEAFFVNSQQIG